MRTQSFKAATSIWSEGPSAIATTQSLLTECYVDGEVLLTASYRTERSVHDRLPQQQVRARSEFVRNEDYILTDK